MFEWNILSFVWLVAAGFAFGIGQALASMIFKR